MNWIPFIPEEDEFRISYTGGTAVTARAEGKRFEQRVILPAPAVVARIAPIAILRVCFTVDNAEK